MTMEQVKILNKNHVSGNEVPSMFESFMITTSDAIIITDIKTNIINFSNKTLSLLGIQNKQNLRGKSISSLFTLLVLDINFSI